jgi:hypothetical protein
MGTPAESEVNRRAKVRFPIHRELWYKMLESDPIVKSGMGETLDMASGGLAFQIDRALQAGAILELSISWPVLLENGCPMRLIVSGRVVRNWGRKSACIVNRYEFRTQARTLAAGGRAPR